MKALSDIEMTLACAAAVGFVPLTLGHGIPQIASEHSIYVLDEYGDHEIDGKRHRVYDPLHDDAQAMALVRKFEPDIVHSLDGFVTVSIYDTDALPHSVTGKAPDLIRCICECVANIARERGEGEAK